MPVGLIGSACWAHWQCLLGSSAVRSKACIKQLKGSMWLLMLHAEEWRIAEAGAHPQRVMRASTTQVEVAAGKRGGSNWQEERQQLARGTVATGKRGGNNW